MTGQSISRTGQPDPDQLNDMIWGDFNPHIFKRIETKIPKMLTEREIVKAILFVKVRPDHGALRGLYSVGLAVTSKGYCVGRHAHSLLTHLRKIFFRLRKWSAK